MTPTSPPDGRRKRPPGPSRLETFRLLRLLLGDRLTLMSEAADRFGNEVRLAIGPKTLNFFNHPDYAKHVLADNSGNYHKGIGLHQARRALGDGLLTSEGELWHKQRKTIQPAFKPRRMAVQADAIAEEAAKLVARLRSTEGTGPVNISAEMTGLTLGVLGRTLLDEDLSGYHEIGHAFETVQDQAMFDMLSLGAVPAFLPLPLQIRFRRARARLERVVNSLVATRRDHPSSDGDDVLSRLIESVRQESDSTVARTRLRDELVTLLLAGHETTASTLSWAFHLVDQHPAVRDRLREEAVRVLGDRQPTYEDLHGLTYTTMVIEESMRLYPPVWMLSRIAQGPDEIGGYPIRAGADVVICPYTMHRHPEFWSAPTRFEPDRFEAGQRADRPRYAYLPFGAGPRFCVGNNLGMMEAVFVLAMVMRELRLRAVPGRPVIPEAMLSLRVRGGLHMTVESI
jgi:enediyne biosynthesis protein E7